MSFRGLIRRRLASWLTLAILFTQIATAAHACPMNQVAASAMPCAAMMAASVALDVEQPGLCLQHCQQGNTQAADHSPVPLPPLPALVALFTLSPNEPPADVGSQLAAHERRRDHAPPLAHSILHCCYRI
jgi:hypothetical protein